MSLSPLRQFVLSAMLWLPLAFFFWFLFAGPLVWPVAHLTDWIVPNLLPNAVASVQLHGSLFEVETRMLTDVGSSGKQGLLILELRPLIYAWCLPLFVGLVMATPLEKRQRWKQLLIGMLVLWLIVTWGVVFDILKLLAFDAGPLGAAAMSAAGIPQDVIALGYQFGYLILPAVTPVAVWVLLNRVFLESLVGWSGEPTAADDGLSQPMAGRAADSAESTSHNPASSEPIEPSDSK